MERFVSGDIVVVNFPFSDLTESKKRPALVLKNIAGTDLILCQVTSNSYQSSEEVIITNDFLLEGKLKKPSYVRFTKLFTADESLIQYKLGNVNNNKLTEILNKLHEYLISD